MRVAPAVLALLFWGFSLGVGSPVFAADEWDRHPGWGGAWSRRPEIEKLLGVAQKVDKQKSHPKTIRFSFLSDKQNAVAVMGEDTVKSTQERFSKMKQAIVAAGSWKADSGFKGYAERDPFFFVTQKEGVTFVWIGTPTKSFHGAEVHFVRGADPQHDLLVLDFGMSNWMKKRNRQFSGNAVGYTRGKD